MLKKLLSSGYFPKELPPIFNTEDFSENLFDSADIDVLVGNRWQNSTPYHLRLKPHERRKLDILCPQSYLRIASTIDSNFSEIASLVSRIDGHISQPNFSGSGKFKRAIQAQTTGKLYSQKKLKLRSRFPTILKLDIKNYYRSIYTHSIPWAIHGKRYAKSNLRNYSLIGNELDRVIQYGQDGQTMGIPTGPDTSFLIAEVLLSQIFQLLINDEKIKHDRFIRYYDDIEYGCENETEAHFILSVFHDYLGEFELEVNPDKVDIFSGPRHIESPWLYQLNDISNERINTNDLIDLFSFLSDLSRRYPSDHVFRYFLRKMRASVVLEDAWEVYQSILLSLFHEERGNAKEIFEQFRYYQKIGWTINKGALKEALDRKVVSQLKTSITSELSWAIYGYFLFEIKLEKELGEKVLYYGDCVSKVLVTKLIFDRGMSLRSVVNTIVKSFDINVLNSSDWLFAYEIMINGWHNRYNSIEISENPALFELLRDEKVSFLEDSITDSFMPQAFQRVLDAEDFDGIDHFEQVDEDGEDEEESDYGGSDQDEEDEDDFFERLFREIDS